MKKTFFKHLLLTISLCLVLYVFLKSAILDKTTLYILENFLVGRFLDTIEYFLIVESTLTIINNIIKLILIIIAFACFIPHVILLDTKKKYKIIICLLITLIFGLFLIVRLNPIYFYVRSLLTQLVLNIFSFEPYIDFIISIAVSSFTMILTNLLKIIMVCLSLTVLIIYIKAVDINKKFKKTILVLSIITVVLYILGTLISSLLNIYDSFCIFINLPNLFSLLRMLPIPYWIIHLFYEFIKFKSMYILPFILLIVLFISCIIYLIVSCKNSLPDKHKKLYIILLIPFILTIVLFIINFTLRTPLFLLLFLDIFRISF